jgi:WD40 repeat protein
VSLDGRIKESSAHLVRRLADDRLLVTARSAGAEETVEVAHEALIRNWKTLRGWLTDERDFFAWRERLRGGVDQWEKAAEVDDASLPRSWSMRLRDRWKKAGEVKDTFLRGAPLKEADANREKFEAYLSDRERRFIAASLAYRERLLRLKISGLAVAALVGAILASVASLGWRRAEEQRHIAVEQTQKAVAARLVAQAELVRNTPGGNLQHSALLAVESMYRFPNGEADRALRHALKLLPRPITNLAHGAAVAAVTYSPNGRYLVTASEEAAQLWDATNGARIGQPVKHAGKVNAVVFSPDGQFFATASQDKTARLWKTATSETNGFVMQHARGVAQVVFSPNGRRLATLSYDNLIRIWSTNSDEPTPITNKAIVKAIAFGPEARTLAVAYNDGFVRLWDVATRQEIASMKHEGAVRSVGFNREGDLLATGSEDDTARVWRATRGGAVWEPLIKVLHQGDVVAAVFSPDGLRLATAGHDYNARVWDTQTGQELARMTHNKEVSSVAFSPDGKRLTTASDDGTARTWEITGYSEFLRKGAEAELKAIAFNPDGRYFAAAGLDQTVRLYETTTGKEMTNFVHAGPLTAIAFSPDGRYLATACGGRSSAACV